MVTVTRGALLGKLASFFLFLFGFILAWVLLGNRSVYFVVQNVVERNLASTAPETRCPLYTHSKFNSLKGSCPLITQEDVIEIQTDCLKSLEEESPYCGNIADEISDSLWELQIKVEKYDEAKESDEDYDAIGLKDDEKLYEYYNTLDGILSEIEKAKREHGCSTLGGVYGMLPLIGRFLPSETYAFAASVDIGTRIYRVLSGAKPGFAEKVKLCEANEKMREARSASCRKVRLSNPEYSQLVKSQMAKYERLQKKGEKTKTYDFLETMGWMCRSLKEKLKSTEIERGLKTQNIYWGALTQMKSQINCDSGEKGKFLCEEISSAIDVANPDNLDWKNEQATEQFKKLRDFTCYNWNSFMYDAVLSEFTREGLENVDIYREVSKAPNKPFNLMKETVYEGIMGREAADNNDGFKVGKAYFQNLLGDVLSSEDIIKQVNISFENIPASINLPTRTEPSASRVSHREYCEAVSCLWAKGKVEMEKLPKELENAAQLVETGISPLERLDYEKYEKMGAKSFMGWSERMGIYKKRMKYIEKKCTQFSKSDLACKLNCQLPLYLAEEIKSAREIKSGNQNGSYSDQLDNPSGSAVQ